jgi:hypothetical protein
VERILGDPIYTGMVAFNGQLFDRTHEAIMRYDLLYALGMLKPTLSSPTWEKFDLVGSRIPKQAKAFDRNFVEAFHQVMNLPLHQDLDAMNACSKLEDPTQGGPRRGLVALIRSRFMAIGS